MAEVELEASTSSLKDICEQIRITIKSLGIKVQEEDLHFLLGFCTNWKLLAYKLGFTKNDCAYIDEREKEPRLKRMEFLNKWHSKGKATYYRFLNALCEIEEVNGAECLVEELLSKGKLMPKLSMYSYDIVLLA